MGSNLCSQEVQERDPLIFDYRYGEDDKEIKIKHNDPLSSSLGAIRPSLEDCESKLKYSEKRFKDVNFSSDPLKLSCDGKIINCHFERPEAFLKRDENLRNKIYKIVNRQNCKSSNIIMGDEVMQYLGVFQCYLADNPDLIDQIILTRPSSFGIHALYVVYQGKREVLFIDDYILCNNQGPLFSRPIKYTDMWTCLIQKAWLKLKSFVKTGVEKVHPIEIFKSFLMYPIKSHPMGEDSEENLRIIKQKLLDPQAKGVNVGCVITSKMTPPYKIGISGRRYFYLKKILFVEGKPYFYLRNPCGQFDFRGNLCDLPQNIEKVIIDTTKQLPAPGDFVLTQTEFVEQIQSFFTILYNPNSPIISDQEVNFFGSQTQEVYLKFNLKKSCPVSLRLYQMSTIGYDPLTYLMVDTGRKSIASGERNQEGCFGVEEAGNIALKVGLLNTEYQMLMPGQYIIRLRKKPEKKSGNSLEWLAGATLKNKDIVLCTAQEEIKFVVSNEFKTEFQEVLKDYAKKELAQNPRVGREEIDHIILWLGDIVVLYISKLKQGKEAISVELSFPELKNLECINQKIGTGYSSLPPFEKDALVIFEKKILTEATSIGSYNVSAF